MNFYIGNLFQFLIFQSQCFRYITAPLIKLEGTEFEEAKLNSLSQATSQNNDSDKQKNAVPNITLEQFQRVLSNGTYSG